jgi:hypothetical protein
VRVTQKITSLLMTPNCTGTMRGLTDACGLHVVSEGAYVLLLYHMSQRSTALLLLLLQSDELLPQDGTWKEVRKWLHNSRSTVLLVLENTEDVLRHRDSSRLVRAHAVYRTPCVCRARRVIACASLHAQQQPRASCCVNSLFQLPQSIGRRPSSGWARRRKMSAAIRPSPMMAIVSLIACAGLVQQSWQPACTREQGLQGALVR